MDIVELRAQNRDRWERSAAGWGARRAWLQRNAAPVSLWMIEAIDPQPGEVVLELAAGPGDTGMLAAELVAPGGRLICTDVAEAMLDVARARAAELGLANVEFRRVDAEAIDLEAASVDAVLCRWGYMFVTDLGAALTEARRVLRVGGRMALATWGAAQANPWAAISGTELERRGLVPPQPPGAPGMFRLAEPGELGDALGSAGFADVVVEPLDLAQTYASTREWWDVHRQLNRALADVTAALGEAEQDELYASLAAQLEPFAAADGTLSIPARALVAAATA